MVLNNQLYTHLHNTSINTKWFSRLQTTLKVIALIECLTAILKSINLIFSGHGISLPIDPPMLYPTLKIPLYTSCSLHKVTM